MAASTRCLELPSPGSFLTRSFQKAETQARHHGLGPLSVGEAAGASQGTPQPTAHQHWPRDLRSTVLAMEPGGGEAGMYSACGGEARREEADRRPPLSHMFHIVLPGLPWGPAPSQPWCQALGCGRCALRGCRLVAPPFFPLPRSPSVPGPWRGDPEEGAAWPTADVTWTPCGLRGSPSTTALTMGGKLFCKCAHAELDESRVACKKAAML